MTQRPSNCSSGVDVDFYWRDTQSKNRQDHVDAAVESVFKALESPTRLWNRWSRNSTKGDIRALVQKASKGNLEPLTHVKSLRNGIGDLFEIRWQHLNVVDKTPNGQAHSTALARLIHMEPLRGSVCAIGIRSFEKPQSGNGKRIQDIEIDKAERYAQASAKQDWGIPLGELDN